MNNGELQCRGDEATSLPGLFSSEEKVGRLFPSSFSLMEKSPGAGAGWELSVPYTRPQIRLPKRGVSLA